MPCRCGFFCGHTAVSFVEERRRTAVRMRFRIFDNSYVSHTSIGPDQLTIIPDRQPVIRHGDRSQDRPPWNLSSSNPQYRPSYSSSVVGDPPGVPTSSLRSSPSVPALQGPSTQVHTVSPSDTEPHTPRPGYIRHLVTGPSYKTGNGKNRRLAGLFCVYVL